jgi:hypothetical protein
VRDALAMSGDERLAGLVVVMSRPSNGHAAIHVRSAVTPGPQTHRRNAHTSPPETNHSHDGSVLHSFACEESPLCTGGSKKQVPWTRPMVPSSAAALIVAHPGHELRLHHWLETVKPQVFVLTDGSASHAKTRVQSTLRLLEKTGARPGSVMGAFPDRELYRVLMEGDTRAMERITNAIADTLAAQAVDLLVMDACEFYNPAHDLSRVVGSLAAGLAQRTTGRHIRLFDYAVVGSPAATGAAGEEILHLDDVALRRKVEAGLQYEGLTEDVDLALRLDAVEAFRVEALRPIDGTLLLPPLQGRPYYETVGEERVAAGLYSTVLEYDRHFVPFVTALAATVLEMVEVE